MYVKAYIEVVLQNFLQGDHNLLTLFFRTLLKAAADELENLLNEDSEPSQSMANNQEKFSRVSPSPTGNILDEILELL